MSSTPSDESWRESLPDDLKTDPNIVKFKSPAELAKGYAEASKLIGSSIRPPGPDASAEAKKEFIEKLQKAVPDLVYAPENADEAVLAQFWRRLGKPEKAEEYEVPEEVAKEIDLAAARAQAQEAGLTKKQFEALAKQTAAAKKAAQAEFDKAKVALKEEWGAAYQERLTLAAAAAAKLGLSDAAVKAIVAGEVAPDRLREYFAIAQAVGASPKELAGQKGTGSGVMTPSEAEQALSEIYGNKKHAFWDAKHPDHDRAIKRVVELGQLADPKSTTDMTVLRSSVTG